ncbi:MAG: SpoIIE family protein phosphatase [Candidatus Eremiobacteraeota bacterium]|nr:SpoIIE family protein phosphatase [Candidatus Eremiobacteraeota bacterium]
MRAAVAAACTLVIGFAVEDMRRRAVSTKASGRLEAGEEAQRVRRLERMKAALRRAQERLSALSEALPFGMWELDGAGSQIVHASDSYCQLFGMNLEEIAAHGWRERVPPDDAERFLSAWNARGDDDIFEGEYRVHAVDGKTYWILSRGMRLTAADGTTSWAGFSLDITQRKRSEQRISLLSDLGRVLSLSLEPQPILERVAELLVPRVADWCAIDLAGRDQGIERAVLVHRDRERMRAARCLTNSAQLAALLGTASARVIASGEPILVRSFPREVHQSAMLSPEQLATAQAFRADSVIVVPLIARDQTLGSLTVAVDDPWQRYESDDVDFMGIVGRRVALAFDNALLYERERRVADMFQRASLPASLPAIPGIAIHAHYVPGANEAQVGGDWYDAFQLADGRIGISIGDVAGKGLHAASIMSTVRLFIRATALEGLAPSLVLARANALLLNDKPTMVTALFGTLDPEELTFTCAVAGHPLPVVVDAAGEATTGVPVAPPLGITIDTSFPEQTFMLPLGSLMALYTDGLVESAEDARYGEADLVKAVRGARSAHDANPAEGIAKLLLGDAPPSDDVAVLTVQAAAKPLLELDLTLPAQPVSSRLFRQALRRFYLAAGVTTDAIPMLQVAMGEAITNSIQHAYGVQGGVVRVQGRVESGRLIVEIADTGRWRGPHDDGGGYGLQIVRSIVNDVTINTDERGTIIRMVHPIGRFIT